MFTAPSDAIAYEPLPRPVMPPEVVTWIRHGPGGAVGEAAHDMSSIATVIIFTESFNVILQFVDSVPQNRRFRALSCALHTGVVHSPHHTDDPPHAPFSRAFFGDHYGKNHEGAG
jgi:hypothetical protein